eukprot:2457018-Pleurochrysis_carterae.AAC.3
MTLCLELSECELVLPCPVAARGIDWGGISTRGVISPPTRGVISPRPSFAGPISCASKLATRTF